VKNRLHSIYVQEDMQRVFIFIGLLISPMTPKFGENLENFQSMQKKHLKLKVMSFQII